MKFIRDIVKENTTASHPPSRRNPPLVLRDDQRTDRGAQS